MVEDEGLSQDGGTGEEEEEEGRKALGRKGPKMPTKSEQEGGARARCPYRSWCRRCVQSRARNSPHGAGEEMKGDEEGVGRLPSATLDYFSMCKTDGKASQNPLMVVVDEESGSRYARAVAQKGLGMART